MSSLAKTGPLACCITTRTVIFLLDNITMTLIARITCLEDMLSAFCEKKKLIFDFGVSSPFFIIFSIAERLAVWFFLLRNGFPPSLSMLRMPAAEFGFITSLQYLLIDFFLDRTYLQNVFGLMYKMCQIRSSVYATSFRVFILICVNVIFSHVSRENVDSGIGKNRILPLLNTGQRSDIAFRIKNTG